MERDLVKGLGDYLDFAAKHQLANPEVRRTLAALIMVGTPCLITKLQNQGNLSEEADAAMFGLTLRRLAEAVASPTPIVKAKFLENASDSDSEPESEEAEETILHDDKGNRLRDFKASDQILTDAWDPESDTDVNDRELGQALRELPVPASLSLPASSSAPPPPSSSTPAVSDVCMGDTC